MTNRFYYLLTKGMLKQPPIKPPEPSGIARNFELNVLDDTDSIVGTTEIASFDAIVDVIVPANDGKGIELQTQVTIDNLFAGTTITKVRWSLGGNTLHEEAITPFTYEFDGEYIVTEFKVRLSNADNGLLYCMTYGLLLENTNIPSTLQDNTSNNTIEILNSSDVLVGNVKNNVALTFPPDGKGISLDLPVRIEGFTSGDVAAKARLSRSEGDIQVLDLLATETYSNVGSYTLTNFIVDL